MIGVVRREMELLVNLDDQNETGRCDRSETKEPEREREKNETAKEENERLCNGMVWYAC